MKKLVVLIIFLVVQNSFAQDFRFGKVSEKELMEKAHPKFPEANAAVLYKNQFIKFEYIQGKGFVQQNEVYERIKIYNKDGFDYATKMLRLYVNSEGSSTYDESLLGLKAYTYNLVDGKIQEDKLKKEGVFEEKTNKFWRSTKFTMPNIKEGCIIEFQYTIQSIRVGIDDIQFQQLIPIDKFDFKMKTPEYYKYKMLMNPKASYVPKLATSRDKSSATITSKERIGYMTTKTEFTTSKLDFITDVVTASLSDIPPLKDEQYVDNLSNYQSRLIMELNWVQFPNEAVQPLSTTWEKVTETIYDDSDFGSQLQKKGYYEKEIDALLSGISDPLQKAEVVFNFIKSKVKWNGYNGYTTDDGVTTAYKEGNGNAAEINLMLVSILRYAGLEANPILVSTKDNGIPLLPTRSGFNYVICGLVINEDVQLLDATQKFSTINILPIKSLNWMGRLIRKDKTSDWIDLTPKTISKESVSLSMTLNADLSATGKVIHQFTEYQAFNKRDRFQNFSNEQMIETLEKDKGELEILNLDMEHMKDVSQPILQSYEYSVQNAMEDIGGKLYFTPLLFLAPTENPFKEEKREYPIDFVFPIADKFMLNILLPEGYEVESLPESTKFAFNGTEGAFTYIGRQNGTMLQFTISLELNKALILASDYEQFKKFYQFMIEKETEKVVLKKV